MGPINVWSSLLEIGKYDIVIDGNGNGIYDEGVDARAQAFAEEIKQLLAS